MALNWFVAISKPAKETVAAVAIAEKGFSVFLPMDLVWRSHAGKREQVNRPLFPRYIFTQFDRAIDDFSRIFYCRGIAHSTERKGIICDAMDRPVRIRDAMIEGIRDRERIERAKAGLETTGYIPGDKFLFRVSKHADIEATYIGEDGGWVTISYSLFGKHTVQEIPFERMPLPNEFDKRVA